VNKAGNLPVGIILTGGGANMKDIEEVVKKEINLPCRISNCDKFIGMEKDPGYSTVCGLVMLGDELEDFDGSSNGVLNWFKEALKKFFP
jgi:cell division ATPase FtsA